MRLPPRKDSAFLRQLTDAQYWKLVFPAYDEARGVLPQDARTCTGEAAFSQPAFQDSQPKSSPLHAETGDIVFGGGANRIKVVWLKTHVRPDGDAVGVLAIVRATDDLAEVYAVGVYRGNAKQSRFGLERMGSELLVTALDDRCTGRNPADPCDTTLMTYLPWSGKLRQLAEIQLERVRFSSDTERGATGKLEYRLVTSPSFKPAGIELLEQVSVKDADGHELRKAERQRSLAWDHAEVVSSSDSLWDRVYVASPAAPATKPRANQ